MTVFHRPVPGGRRGWQPICGHRFSDGRYCGGAVYEFRHPSGHWYWKHYPSDTMRRLAPAMPEGWQAFPPAPSVRGLRPEDEL